MLNKTNRLQCGYYRILTDYTQLSTRPQYQFIDSCFEFRFLIFSVYFAFSLVLFRISVNLAMGHNQGGKEATRSKILTKSLRSIWEFINGRLNQNEFNEVKGVALNQTRSPRKERRWRAADPFEIGAGETQQSVMVSFAVTSRGLRLHRVKRTDHGTTRRVTGTSSLRKHLCQR